MTPYKDSMLRNLYKLFIAPTQVSEDARNRELVLNVLLSTTLLFLCLSLPIFLYNYFILDKSFAPARMLWVLILLAFVAGLYGLSRGGRYRIAAFLLVGTYFLLAGGVIAEWGVTTPTGILLLGLVIVLSGILLGSHYGLYAAAAVIAFLFTMHIATTQGVVHPDLSWTVAKPEIGDVIAFSLIFCFLAVISWLFNHQMEHSLKRAERAEAALQRQKASLEETVVERTRQLQAEQLERMQQMYRFAELGQMSTALLHELANHLTTITLDIEGLQAKEKTKSSNVLQQAKRSIHYIDKTVQRVRDQLHGKSQSQLFNVVTQIDEVSAILQHKAAQANVQLVWQPPANRKGLRCRGESIRFRQLIANLLSNAIEAYDDNNGAAGHRDVVVTAEAKGKQVIITINDWGRGIAPEDRIKLFEPFYSTKKTGMGMGLYIAQQIAEDHLHGQLAIDRAKLYTSFVLTLRKAGS